MLQLSYQSTLKLQSSSAVVTFFLTNGVYAILFSIEAAVAVISTYIVLKQKSRSLIIPLVFLAVTILFVVLGKEVWYVAYLSPAIALTTAILIHHGVQNHQRRLILTTAIIIASFVFTSLFILVQLVRERSDMNYIVFSQPFVNYFRDAKGIVCVASTPDPSYKLRSNPNIIINQLVDVSGFIPRKKQFFDACDWFVGNLNPGDYGIAYLMRNGQTRQIIEYPSTFPIEIVKLRPESERN